MNKSACLLFLLPLLGGCFSSPKAPTYWDIDWVNRGENTPPAKPLYADVARVTLLNVRAPSSDARLTVLRGNGSVAFDGCNAFAGSPASLIRGVLFDAVASSGLFTGVISSSSQARAPYVLEFTVTELALDCRTGDREALVSLQAGLFKDRVFVASFNATARAPAGSGDYTAAFSKATSDAAARILEKLAKRK